MKTLQPETFQLLLNVFYSGLINGIISKGEVTEWADETIKKENEPDYFFIEISLCHDTGDLVDVINNHLVSPINPIPTRVLFGIAYQKLITAKIDIKKVYALFDSALYKYQLLSSFERGWLYQLDDDYYDLTVAAPDQKDQQPVHNDTIKFLHDYAAFNLQNYNQWHEINLEIESTIAEMQAGIEAEGKKWREEYEAQKLAEKQRLSREQRLINIVVAILIAASVINVIITHHQLANHDTLTKFRHDLYYICTLFLFFSCGYLIIIGFNYLFRKIAQQLRR
jgi:hypothetical protein